MIPLLLLYKIFQLFFVMVIGFALVKLRLIKSEDSLALSRISLYILMPCAIINSFNISLTKDIISGLILSFGAGIAIHLLLLAIDAVFRKAAKATAVERASVFYSNAANLIIPIVSFVLGDEWVIYTLGFMSVQLAFLWSHGVGIFEPRERVKLKKIFLNPNILAIIFGLIILVSGIRLPKFATEITASFGGVLGYVGMLIAGMTAATLDFKKALANKRLYLSVIMRVVICPLIIFILLWISLCFINIANAKQILLISFLATTTPSAASIMQLSQLYETEVDYSVAINILSTVLSCATIPLFVVLYQII